MEANSWQEKEIPDKPLEGSPNGKDDTLNMPSTAHSFLMVITVALLGFPVLDIFALRGGSWWNTPQGFINSAPKVTV